ncbi:MAG: hypothetical protein R2784_02230 [Saprospiraceae bacterium]
MNYHWQTFSTDTVCVGSATHFQNTTPDTNIVSYAWSFAFREAIAQLKILNLLIRQELHTQQV